MSQTRQPVGVPTGGQFSTSARNEAEFELGHADDADTFSKCPVTWGERCVQHRRQPGTHSGDLKVEPCNETPGRWALCEADFNREWNRVEDFASRDEARSGLRYRVSGEPETPVETEPDVPLVDAVTGYRMNRTAVRTSIDAYSEVIQANADVAHTPEYRRRLAERVANLDEAALCMHTSLRALRPHLDQDERFWADRLGESVNDPGTSAATKVERLSAVIRSIGVGYLERAVLRQRALDPDDQVFGSDRPEAARYARWELTQAEEAYDTAGGGWLADDHPARLRVVRARRAHANYPGYVD